MGIEVRQSPAQSRVWVKPIFPFTSYTSFQGEVPANGRGTTVNLALSYLAPAKSETVQAVARVLRRGRNLVLLDVEVTDTSGYVVAKGLVTYKLG